MRWMTVMVAGLIWGTVQAAPVRLSHQGRVLDSIGAPVEGAQDIGLSLFDSETGTTPFWTYTWEAVALADGYYALDIGAPPSPTLDSSAFGRPEVWVQADIGGAIQPRALLSSVPLAAQAEVAIATRASVVVDAVNAGSVKWAGSDVLRRSYPFTKQRDDTKALFFWYDNLRCTGETVACRWEVRFRPASGGVAQPCTVPATIKADFYNSTGNFHIPSTVTGMCTATASGPLSAGDWVAEVYLLAHPHTAAEGVSWTGWDTTASTFAMLEVE